jgi:hypothetical protein
MWLCNFISINSKKIVVLMIIVYSVIYCTHNGTAMFKKNVILSLVEHSVVRFPNECCLARDLCIAVLQTSFLIL